MKAMMSILLGAALLSGAPAPARTDAKSNAAIKPTHPVNDGSATRGANSFTEAQAREHIAKSGFTDVSTLKKDKDGVWRGTAQKDGTTLHVALDFKGNVITAE
jgi:putative membrane protein